MITLRDEMYFEPRVINIDAIRWYGERYSDDKLTWHDEETVYVRDNGEHLFIYELKSDGLEDAVKIEAVFTLICKIPKNNKLWKYGRKVKK